LLRIQAVRILAWDVRARAAAGRATRPGLAQPERARLLKGAAADARRIAREKMAWAQPLAQLRQADIATIRGERPQALALLRDAEAGFEAAAMALHAAVARYRRGELLTGPAGRALVEEADRWFASQELTNPRRMVAMLAPGARSTTAES